MHPVGQHPVVITDVGDIIAAFDIHIFRIGIFLNGPPLIRPAQRLPVVPRLLLRRGKIRPIGIARIVKLIVQEFAPADVQHNVLW